MHFHTMPTVVMLMVLWQHMLSCIQSPALKAGCDALVDMSTAVLKAWLPLLASTSNKRANVGIAHLPTSYAADFARLVKV